MQSTRGLTAQAASLASLLSCLMPWEPRESRWESYDHVLSCASTTVEVERPDGSPKVDFAMLLLLRSEELGSTAHMGAQPTHGSVQDSHS